MMTEAEPGTETSFIVELSIAETRGQGLMWCSCNEWTVIRVHFHISLVTGSWITALPSRATSAFLSTRPWGSRPCQWLGMPAECKSSPSHRGTCCKRRQWCSPATPTAWSCYKLLLPSTGREFHSTLWKHREWLRYGTETRRCKKKWWRHI